VTSSGPIRRLATAAGRLVRPGRRRGAAGDAHPTRPGEPGGPDRGDATGPVIDGVEVDYAPELDGDPDPGEVVWAWVPYEEDANQGKDRPVLILGWDGDRLAGVPLSSKDPRHRHDARTRVPVGTGGWDRDRRPSWADAERLLRFAPNEIRREGSSIPRDRFDEVVARVRQLHG
jgi:hypothetical protein